MGALRVQAVDNPQMPSVDWELHSFIYTYFRAVYLLS